MMHPLHLLTLGHEGVRVAVLDGPVDLEHPCFAGAHLQKVKNMADPPVGTGRMSRHGTHIASVLFGQPDSPVHGLAPRCTGLLVPIFRDNQDGSVSQLNLARAIQLALEAGANVINISGGELDPSGEPEGALRRALQLCEDSGVLVVAAAGNDGCECLHVPAAVPATIAVGALGVSGAPLDSSNWGAAYKSNGVLAAGEHILGAAPGGGTARASGSSFAAPVVAGAAALLMSLQRARGQPPDAKTVRDAILGSAERCQPEDSHECARYLAGTLNVAGAYQLMTLGGSRNMSDMAQGHQPMTVPQVANVQEGAPHLFQGYNPSRVAAGVPGVVPAAAGPPVEAAVPAGVAASEAPHSAGYTRDSQVVAASAAPAAAVVSAPAAPVAYAPTEPAHPTASALVPSGHEPALATPIVHPGPGVRPSEGCGCESTPTSNIFAIGTLGFDFGTEARRDTFRQLMPPLSVGEPPVTLDANPYDPTQLARYLNEDRPSDSTKLIWTLNLDLTPIYAVVAEPSYPEDVYREFRNIIGQQVLDTTDPVFVSRVSLSGVLSSKTVRLFSGQVVPVVVVQPRGMYSWHESALVDLVVDAVANDHATEAEATDDVLDATRRIVRNYLDKIYYELRNLGQSAPDRALNFAATNAFVFTQGIVDMISSGKRVSGGNANLYTLDTITVAKSAYCRMDSDCWDVRLTFFDPENDQRARTVFQATIDVSDELPVQLSATHVFSTAIR